MSELPAPAGGDSILAQCYRHAISFAETNIQFADRLARIPSLNGNTKVPWYHQLRRLRAILTMPRVLLADETGLGKTAVVVLAKLFEELDPESRALLLDHEDGASTPHVQHGKRKIAIVFSTLSGMRDPWNEDEINAYAPTAFPRQRILQLRATQDIGALRDTARRTEPVDFLIVNYEKLLIPNVVRALVQIIAANEVSLIALDECHQLRNPHAQRFIPADTHAIRSGFLSIMRAMRKVESPPKLLLLSATPIANLPSDLGVLVHLLDPTQDIHEVRSTRNLQLLRDFFWQGLTFRLDKRMARDLLGLPELTEMEECVAIRADEADAYAAAWEQLVVGGGKIRSLAHALFAPKLRYLEEHVGRWRAKGKQVVIFTGFRTGVTRELAERLDGTWIDGDVPIAMRSIRARAFRDGATPVLVATTRTSAESISLVTGHRPCVVIRFEPFFTPYEWVQSVGRVWRPGQRGPVTVVTLVAGGDVLADRLESVCARVEDRYLLRRQRTWKSSSFDEDQLAINAQKRLAADQLYAGHPVTKLTTRLLSTTEANLRVEMASLKFDSPSHRACFTARCWIGRGLDYFQKTVATAPFKRYITDYNDYWEFTASAHTAELIRRIVEAHEQQTRRLHQIVDQGAGPGCIARALHRSMTAIDLSAEMLNLARKEVHRINRKTGARITLRTIVKPIQACGLPDQSTDLAVAAYVLQYARQSRHPMNTGEREIEHIILETNRILTPQGFWIVALPYNISRAMIERFQRVVGQYGFDVLPTSGFYRPALAQDADGHTHAPTSSFHGVWIIVAQKQTQMTTLIEPAPIGLSFQPITLAGGVTRRGLRKTRTRKLITPERIVAFRHESGRSLDTLASRAAADPPRTIRDDRIVR